MASAPRWKIYDAEGVYQAACKEPEAAACLVSFYGERATIRDGHAFIVWTEGQDGIAQWSYDTTAETLFNRIK
jgi:hypothetical protein